MVTYSKVDGWRYRRRTIAGLFVATGLIAAACGADDSANEQPNASESSPSTSAAEAEAGSDESVADEPVATDAASDDAPTTSAPADESAFPVEVEHLLGTTTIEERPERVFAITEQAELATLYSLGVEPIGFGERGGGEPELPWLVEFGAYDDDVTRIPLVDGVPVEAIAALQPDLIVGQEGFLADDGERELLEQIAPTIATESDDWRRTLDIIAQATGRTAEAAALEADLDDQLAAIAERVPEAADRDVDFAVWVPPRNSYFQYTSSSAISEVAAAAGLAPLPEPTDPALPDGNSITDELVGLLDGEALILLDFTGQGIAQYDSNPLWSSLPAVQSGAVTVLDTNESSVLQWTSALTLPILIDIVERNLEILFGDGDPTAEPDGGTATASDVVAAGAAGGATFIGQAAQASPAFVEATTGPGPVTVFLPSDDALFALQDSPTGAAMQDPALLDTVLRYHVTIDGALTATELIAIGEIDTLAGEVITVSVDGDTVLLNGGPDNGGVAVSAADLIADNGIAHVIDGLLIPPSLADQLGG